jgi:hypothetical protein
MPKGQALEALITPPSPDGRPHAPPDPPERPADRRVRADAVPERAARGVPPTGTSCTARRRGGRGAGRRSGFAAPVLIDGPRRCRRPGESCPSTPAT